MTIRRVNHTGRLRLKKGDVNVRVRDGEPPSLSAKVDLGAYRLPNDAPVYLEAYRQTTSRRFAMGTVGALEQPLSCSLVGFGTAAGVRFRLRVVEPKPGVGRPALVLAACGGIRSRGERGEERVESLLVVEPGAFSDRPWRLEIEDGQAIIRVSRALILDASAFVQSKAFCSLVLPEVLRRILEQIVMRDGCTEIDEEEPERSEWLRFAVEHLGVPMPRADDDLTDWVEDAVTAWCRRTGVSEEFSGWWSEDGGR